MAKSEADKAAKAERKAAEAAAAAAAQAEADKAAAKAAKKAAKGKGSAGGTLPEPTSGGGLVAPGTSGDLFKAKEAGEGAFILFTGTRIDTNVVTEQGTEPEVPRGRVVILDPANPTKPKAVFPDTLVFGKVLLGALREAAETRKSTAGVLASQQYSKGKGWKLEADPKADKAALAYLASINPLAD